MKDLSSVRWLSRVATLLAMTVAVAACGDDDNPIAPVGNTVTVSVQATADQEVPQTTSTGSAAGSISVNDQSGALTGSFTVTGFIPTAAHIHSGFAGANGGVVVPLDITGNTLSVPVGTTLDADQTSALLAGGLYLNVHSDSFPGGEVRGQIVPDGISVITTELSGDSEVPPVSTSTAGSGYVTVNDTTGAVVINVITTGLADPTNAHLHDGITGTNGPVIEALGQDSTDLGLFSSADGATLDSTALATLLAGGTYINVHTQGIPTGELRGQVSP